MIKKKLLLFGGNGTIGQSVQLKFEQHNWDVWTVGRSPQSKSQYVCWNPISENIADDEVHALSEAGPFDGVCWSQGMNLSDNVFEFNVESHRQMYDANVIYILNSLAYLLKNNIVSSPAKFCILSSIWQNISKQNKLSYSVTKSALQGLVLSAANDMAKDGHMINAVLPGAIETPMTRENLSDSQIKKIEQSTQFNRLATLEDVSNAVYFTCSELNSGMTGNFITVDLGFSHARNI
jgi:NAD(P)-dependent dehydrogenase (short-subunit alcohol dehydrogenase family)